MPLFGLRFASADEDERAQKNTFTKWINYHLEEHSSSGRVEDLYEDIKDGVLLCHLIEVLTGEALPVNKARVSKRVHHIANLTTALTVLRRRGLELINNNAADIADGNPRIVLGLIWQIILHFQIETNIALLREWGWAATTSAGAASPPSSPRPSSSRPQTPSRSPLKQRLVSFFSPSSSGPSTSRDSPRVSMKQFKSSVEGVMVRWVNQEVSEIAGEKVTNMDKQWKDGVLFNALVHRWRPDVIDMRRVRESVPRENLENAFEMAHSHLGIRKLLEVDDMLCEKPDKRSVITYVSQFVKAFGERRALSDGHAQHAAFLEWLNVTHIMDLRREKQEVYFRVRREFLEYRSVFNTIMATKMNFTVEELADIERKWDSLRLQLEAAASQAERSLPEPYASLSVWTADGQLLVTKPLSLDSENPRKCASQLQRMIQEHNKHFIELPAKQEQLRVATEKGGLGGRPVAPEFVEPLKARMNILADEAPLRLATLKILLAHYHILAYLEEIEEKIDLWRSADSLALLNRWIKEYGQLHGENPRARCNGYVGELRKTLQHSPPTKLDGDNLIRSSERQVDQTLAKFEKLHGELLKLRALWTEWEENVWELEELARRGLENNTNTLHDSGPALSSLEATADQMAPMMSTSARIAVHHRLEQLRQKMRQMGKFPSGGRLVVEIHPSTSSAPEDERVRTVAGLDDEILKIEMVLRERQQRGTSELQDRMSRMERQRKLTTLRNIRIQMVQVEELLVLLLRLLESPDAYERAKAEDVLSQLEIGISGLQKGEAASIVDVSEYTTKMNTYRSQPSTSASEPPISEEYVREVVERFRLILERRECSEDEVLATRRDVEDCEKILSGWNSKKLEKIRARWQKKKGEFEQWENDMRRLLDVMAHVEKAHFVTGAEVAELRRMERTAEKFTETGLGQPLLLTLTELRIRLIRLLEERLDGLRMAGEEDVAVAYSLMQEVGEELAAWCPELSERFQETRSVLHSKMELFKRLQNFYDAVRSLRARNAQWNNITLSQVPPVDSELEVLIERCDHEWRQDAELLKEELGAIHGSFFQLEFDRVNEKLNMLIFEKEKSRELMVRRREYLAAVREFCAATDSSTDISQHATSSDQPTDPQRLTNDLCVRLEEQARHLRQLGDAAEMDVTDLSTTAAIRNFRRRQLGEEAMPPFEVLSRTLEQFLSRKLTADGPEISEIQRLKQEEEEENRAMEELKDAQREPQQQKEVDRLNSLLERKREQRRLLVEKLVLIRIESLNARFRQLEEDVLHLIHNGKADELRVVSDSLWKQWKEEVADVETSLGPTLRNQFRPELADLERKAFALDGKILRALSQSQKLKKHGEKLASKLATFELWLDSAERDVATIEALQDGPARREQLVNVLRVVLSYQRLIAKLERLNVPNREHVQRLIARYYALRDRLRQYDLPLAEGLPLHIPGTAISQSQISISSLASSEAAERPSSVMSVSSEAAGAEGPLAESARQLRAIQDSYLMGPKTLVLVQQDLLRLQDVDRILEEYLATLLQSESDPTTESSKHRVFHLRGQIQVLREKLQTEIDAELQLTQKQEEILADLAQLENRVRQRDARDIDIAQELDHLQMQMDLLKVISNQPRTYVECDVVETRSREGSPSQAPKRRKKVLVMVTNTVTTIIQVVEEILSVETRVQPPAVLEKINNVKRELKLLDRKEPATVSEPAYVAREGVQKRSPEVMAVLEPIQETVILAQDIAKNPDSNVYELGAARDMLNAADQELEPLQEQAEADRENVLRVRHELRTVLLLVEQRLRPSVSPVEEVSTSTEVPNPIAEELKKVRSSVDLASSVAASPESAREELSSAKDMLFVAKRSVVAMHDVLNIHLQQHPSDLEPLDRLHDVEQDLHNVLAAIDDRVSDKHSTPIGELDEVSTTSLPELTPIQASLELAKTIVSHPACSVEELDAAEDMATKAAAEVREIQKEIKKGALVSSPVYNKELTKLLKTSEILLKDIQALKPAKASPDTVHTILGKIQESVDLASSIEATPETTNDDLEAAKSMLTEAEKDLDQVKTAVEDRIHGHPSEADLLREVVSVEEDLKHVQTAIDDKLQEVHVPSEEHVDAVDVIENTLDLASDIGALPESTYAELQAAKEMLEAAKKDIVDLNIVFKERAKTHADVEPPRKLSSVEQKLQTVLNVVDNRLEVAAQQRVEFDPVDVISDTVDLAQHVKETPEATTGELQAAKDMLEAAKKDVEDLHNVINEKIDKYPEAIREPLRKLSSVEENLDTALSAVSERLEVDKHDHEITSEAVIHLAKVKETVNLASTIEANPEATKEEIEAAKDMLNNADKELETVEVLVEEHLRNRPTDMQIFDDMVNTKEDLKSVRAAVEDRLDSLPEPEKSSESSLDSAIKTVQDVINLASGIEATPEATADELEAALTMLDGADKDLESIEDQAIPVKFDTIMNIKEDLNNVRTAIQDRIDLGETTDTAQPSTSFRSDLQSIQETVDLASGIEATPEATKEDLEAAKDMLESAAADVDRLYDILSSQEENADDILALGDVSAALKNVQTAVEDHLDQIKEGSITPELDKIQQTIDLATGIEAIPVSSKEDLEAAHDMLQSARKSIDQIHEVVDDSLKKAGNIEPLRRLSDMEDDLKNVLHSVDERLQKQPPTYEDVDGEQPKDVVGIISRVDAILAKTSEITNSEIPLLNDLQAASDQVQRAIEEAHETEKASNLDENVRRKLSNAQDKMKQVATSLAEMIDKEKQHEEREKHIQDIKEVIDAACDVECDESSTMADLDKAKATLSDVKNDVETTIEVLLKEHPDDVQALDSLCGLENDIKNVMTAIEDKIEEKTEETIKEPTDIVAECAEILQHADDEIASSSSCPQTIHPILERLNRTLIPAELLDDTTELKQNIEDKRQILQQRLDTFEVFNTTSDKLANDIDAIISSARRLKKKKKLSHAKKEEISRSLPPTLDEVSTLEKLVNKHLPFTEPIEKTKNIKQKIEELASVISPVSLTATPLEESQPVEHSMTTTTQEQATIEDKQKEADDLIMLLTIKITQLQALPIDQLSNEQLTLLNAEIDQLPNSDELRDKLVALQKTKDEHDRIVAEAIKALEDIEKNIADLVPEQKKDKKKKGKKQKSVEQPEEDIPVLEDRLAKTAELTDQLLAITGAPDAARLDDARHKLNEIAEKTKDELTKKKTEEAEKKKASDSLDALEKAVIAADSSVDSTPADNVPALTDLKKDNIPALAAKLEAVGDVPQELKDRKDDLAKKCADVNAKLDDKLQNAIEDQKKTDDLNAKLEDKKKQLDEISEKLQIAQPIVEVDSELQQLKDIIDDLGKLDSEQLEAKPKIAHAVKDIKQKAKEIVSPVEKALPKEKQLRDENQKLKDHLEQLTGALANVDASTPEQQLPVVEQLAKDIGKLEDAVKQHLDDIAHHSPIVSDADLDKTLTDKLPELVKKCNDAKKTLEEAVQVNNIAPEIQLISVELQQRPEEIPESLDDQQAALEDLGARKARLEALMDNIPAGEQGDELRERSAWDLSRLKDLLGQLGAKVGDKLTALAAFNTARKDAEDNLLAITSRPEDDKTPEEIIDQLKKDEDALEKLRQAVANTDRTALDEPQTKEYDDLIARLQKAEDLLKQRRAAAEDQLRQQKAADDLHKKTVPALSRLAELVEEANKLLNDPEGVPTQYQPLSDDLRKEIAVAQDIVNGAPADDDTVANLQKAIFSASELCSRTEEMARLWSLFVVLRDTGNELLETINQRLADVDKLHLLNVVECEELLADLKAMYNDVDELRVKDSQLNDLSSSLEPHNIAPQESRFFAVDVEGTSRSYEEILQHLSDEIDTETNLTRTLEILRTELSQCKEEIDSHQHYRRDRMSQESLLNDIIAHLENQKVIVGRSAENRRFVESSTSTELDELLARAHDLLEELRNIPDTSTSQEGKEEYDVDAAAEVLAALYPNEHPNNVLQQHGFDGLPSDSDSKSEFDSIEGSSDGVLSPVPDDPSAAIPPAQLRRQRSRWRRVLRTALPLQAMLVLLLGAACLVPHCDDEYCCQLLNNFARSFDPSLEFVNGPPPF